MLQLDSNLKPTIYIDWGSLSTNHELVRKFTSSSKYRRFDCWAAVFFRADINAGTGKNRNKQSTASLSATLQKGCPNRVYSPDRVQTEPNYRKQCKHKWGLLLGHQLFMLIAATCPCQCKRATIYMHVALSCVCGDKDNSYSTGAQGQSDKAVVCLHTVQNRWVNTAPTARKILYWIRCTR